MKLTEYADALEKSAKKSDRDVAAYIRKNIARLEGWVRESGNGLCRAME